MDFIAPQIRILTHTFSHRQWWHVIPVGRVFWRFYWNRTQGARIIHEGKTIDLTPDTMALIAPNTPFVGQILDPFDHYFVHFQLGYPYDWLSNRIFISQIPKSFQKRLNILISQECNISHFTHQYQWQLLSILSWMISEVPSDQWPKLPSDTRIRSTISFIDKNTRNIDNDSMAKRINLSCNSFIRLFKQQMGIAPQQYVLEQRLIKACRLLTCSDDTIEAIAETCGFCDRNYFSTVFKRYYKVGPVQYRINCLAEIVTNKE